MFLVIIFIFIPVKNKILFSYHTKECFKVITNLEHQKASEIMSSNLSSRLAYIDSKAELVSCDIFRSYVTPAYASGIARVVVKLNDGSYDAGWYSLVFVPSENWKLIALDREPPYFVGKKPVFLLNKNRIKEPIENYLLYLSKGKYKESTQFLAYEARINQEKNLSKLPEKGIGSIKDLDIKIESCSLNNLAVAKVSYIYQERQVNLKIICEKIKGGWKLVYIYNI